MAEPQAEDAPKRNLFTRFLDGVEWLGNLLPHPVTLFAILAVGIVLLSGLMGWLGIPLDMMTITVAAITVGIAEQNDTLVSFRLVQGYLQ